ncbi:MAG TPA: hypothetical protein VMD79_08210 [Solirubrobacteraceae bacterium]|nr:hypothetical protein [Solirubrobacteraceae bacterium]
MRSRNYCRLRQLSSLNCQQEFKLEPFAQQPFIGPAWAPGAELGGCAGLLARTPTSSNRWLRACPRSQPCWAVIADL